jgi:hypothetical protein
MMLERAETTQQRPAESMASETSQQPTTEQRERNKTKNAEFRHPKLLNVKRAYDVTERETLNPGAIWTLSLGRECVVAPKLLSNGSVNAFRGHHTFPMKAFYVGMISVL